MHVKEKILLKAYTLCLSSFNIYSALTSFSSLVILLLLCLSLLQFIADTIMQCNPKNNLLVPCEKEYASLLFALCAYAAQNCISPIYIMSQVMHICIRWAFLPEESIEQKGIYHAWNKVVQDATRANEYSAQFQLHAWVVLIVIGQLFHPSSGTEGTAERLDIATISLKSCHNKVAWESCDFL